jgi:protein-S-isoprenylcysteine O-methyltransferase Ste14
MEPARQQQDTGITLRLGGWLFRQRSWLPLPIAAALLLLPGRRASAGEWASGTLIVGAGEAIRLWGVHQIGVISRTRTDRLGPLVDTGPFAHVRNPLYLGNILLWVGFAVAAGLPWLAPVVAVLLAAEYHAIVRWEERLLEARLGAAYRDYASRVPRWLPGARRAGPAGGAAVSPAPGFSWRDTLFSERGTLVAIAAGFALLWLKFRLS